MTLVVGLDIADTFLAIWKPVGRRFLLVTASNLQARTSRELAQIAKSEGVRGWHSMRKAELIQALLETSRGQLPQSTKNRNSAAAVSSTGKSSTGKSRKAQATGSVDSRIARQIRSERERQEKLKDLSLSTAADANSHLIKRDRMVLIVRDAWWIQAYWEVTRSSVLRARVALGRQWHSAQPALRLFEVTSDGNTNSVEQPTTDISVSGDARNWFINVPDRTKTYRAGIGYLLKDGQFHLIAKSNDVNLPAPGSCGIGDNWADISVDAHQYFVLSGGQDSTRQSGDLQSVIEERTKQPIEAAFADHAHSADALQAPLSCKVDAEMLVYGSTLPSASVTIGGSPARVQSDGSFAMRVNLPDRRQVLPVVVTNYDGTQQQTTVLAVERNTKTLDLLHRDPDALS